jgi:type IV secretory pathway VirB10-like protein
MKSRTLIALFSLLCAQGLAMAQYIWVDEKGNKQYSDTAPPASVPKSRIIKAPVMSSGTVTAPAATSPAAPSAPAKPQTTASKNEDYNKRRTEQAEAAQKNTAEQQASQDKKQDCERARSYQRSLESGERVANVDSKGERFFLDDNQRSKELDQVKKALANCQ